MATKRVLLTLRFEGSGFYGWQAQRGGNTVQQAVQNAAEKVFGYRPDVSGCGRTDSGVHALGYCCHLDINEAFPAERIPDAFNFYFTRQNVKITVTAAKIVDDDFHSRYCIKTKEYIYLIQNDRWLDPFYEGRAFHCHKKLDIGKMRAAAEILTGRHNFSSFMADRSDIPKEDAVRNLSALEVSEDHRHCALVSIRLRADGFLYKMARIISGTLIDISEEKLKIDDLEEIIESRDRSRAGRTLPAHGLYLSCIEYFTNTQEALLFSGHIQDAVKKSAAIYEQQSEE